MSNFAFICPNCKRKQTSVVRVDKATIDYFFDFKNEKEDEGETSWMHRGYFACDECGEKIKDKNLAKQIRQKIKNIFLIDKLL